MSKLFTPVQIKDIKFSNRIITSPMCMYSATDGFATNWHLVHYGSRAIGGSGAVMLEVSAIRPEGRIAINDLGIWKDEHIEGLAKIASFVKEAGSVPAIQIGHSGRKGSNWVAGGDSHILSNPDDGGWSVIAPSPIPFSDNSLVPTEMTLADIADIRVAFRDAAQRAFKAGFEFLEIHAAHGYLLNQFMSPLSNIRSDEYGGNRDGRTKLLFEVIESVKKVWPPTYPIAVRISATEWIDGGWSIEDSVWLSHKLADKGIDVIDVSSGGSSPDVKIPVGTSYQVPLAKAIKNDVKEKVLVGTVGLITNAAQAESILVGGDADFIFIGRELLRDPYLPLHSAKQLRAKADVPKQYELAF